MYESGGNDDDESPAKGNHGGLQDVGVISPTIRSRMLDLGGLVEC